MTDEAHQTALNKIRSDAINWGNESIVDAFDMLKNRSTKMQAGSYGANEIASDFASALSMMARDAARLANLAAQGVAAVETMPGAPKPADDE